MAKFAKRKILGKWKEGYALDFHTLRSVFLGHDEFGHARFDTERSEIGELLYKLKNQSDTKPVSEIVDAVETLMKDWNPPIEILVPVPPSAQRTVQPVQVLADAINKRWGMPLANCITRTRDSPQLKNVFDLDERAKLLEDLHVVDKSMTEGRSVLLFDDLYRSGATMNTITTDLYESGKAKEVYALTITRTRSNQ